MSPSADRYHGDRFDARILDMVEGGCIVREIAAAIGTSEPFVWRRLDGLGLHEALARRGRERRRSPGRAQGARTPDGALRRVPTPRTDAFASRVAAALRAHRPAQFIASLDPDHVVACLHEAGLTLPEIEAGTGVPQVEVVAAIRAHHTARAA